MRASLLRVERLVAGFGGNPRPAVRGLSFHLAAGRTLGIVGESGSGKSALAQALLGILPWSGGKVLSGAIHFNDRNLVSLGEDAWQELRGRQMTMVFQDPMTSLHPLEKIGRQLERLLRRNAGFGRREARERCEDMLGQMRFSDPRRVSRQYPAALSGGMRQRVMLAMALCSGPDLLIADEPTTALDMVTRAAILNLLKEQQKSLGFAMILISHDLGVIEGICDDVMVMVDGQVVEQAPASDFFSGPAHPYARGLAAAVIRPGQEGPLPCIAPHPAGDESPEGCVFASRCPSVQKRCRTSVPPLIPLTDHPAHRVACIEGG